jgi:hypothetical protein
MPVVNCDRHFSLQWAPPYGLYARELPRRQPHDRRKIRAMAGIGQGWIEEAIPARDGASQPIARLPRSILLLTSP